MFITEFTRVRFAAGFEQVVKPMEVEGTNQLLGKLNPPDSIS